MAFESANPGGLKATIGPSVSVKGEISGDEDILIEGSVEGQINLKKNSVTVAKSGRVKANVQGVVVRVEGEVTGDVAGSEKVIVLASGKVIGNISAPRISLEEGARVKGMLDTEVAGDSARLSSRVEETFNVEQAKKTTNFATKTETAKNTNSSTTL